jgi:hypothetical protein
MNQIFKSTLKIERKSSLAFKILKCVPKNTKVTNYKINDTVYDLNRILPPYLLNEYCNNDKYQDLKEFISSIK